MLTSRRTCHRSHLPLPCGTTCTIVALPAFCVVLPVCGHRRWIAPCSGPHSPEPFSAHADLRHRAVPGAESASWHNATYGDRGFRCRIRDRLRLNKDPGSLNTQNRNRPNWARFAVPQAAPTTAFRPFVAAVCPGPDVLSVPGHLFPRYSGAYPPSGLGQSFV